MLFKLKNMLEPDNPKITCPIVIEIPNK